jgi:hypothetical protein
MIQADFEEWMSQLPEKFEVRFAGMGSHSTLKKNRIDSLFGNVIVVIF